MIEKLLSRENELYGNDKDEYINTVKKYVSIKEDISLIETPIESKDILNDLINNHKKIDDKSNDIEIRKQAMIDSVRLYRKFITSGEYLTFIDKTKKIVEDGLIKGLYNKVLGVFKYTGYNYNLTIGMIRSYYDSIDVLMKSNLNTYLIENVDYWAYKNLEESFIADFKQMDIEKLNEMLNSAYKINLSYIIALYNSSKILYELSKVEDRIKDVNKEFLNGSIEEKIDGIINKIKKGNDCIAFEKDKKERVKDLKKELNNFNSILLNVDRS